MYMYIVHIKITLHIQVLVYCKNISYPLDYGPTQNLSNPLYTAKKYMAPAANQNVHHVLHDLGLAHFWIGLICNEQNNIGG